MSERKRRRGLLPETDAGLLARRPHRIAVLLLVVLACTGLRLVHLEADTPIGVGTGSMGLYIDEGYKTLEARNTVLFGTPRWHPLPGRTQLPVARDRQIAGGDRRERRIDRGLNRAVLRSRDADARPGGGPPLEQPGREPGARVRLLAVQRDQRGEGDPAAPRGTLRGHHRAGALRVRVRGAGDLVHRLRWDEPRGDSHERRDEPRDEESRDG